MESASQEIIYQGNSTISVEVIPDYSDPVVVKKPSRSHSPRRNTRSLENEYKMTQAVDGVAGIRKALAQQSIADRPALILEYIDGETLRYLIKKKTLSLRAKLRIAVDLAHILSEMHQQGVIHLDLNSNNVLVANEDRTVHLIDLASASYIKGNGLLKARPDQTLGMLPYIAPEQTGRINRAVDERSDLYSLGVVLYELMTGQPPFDSRDPQELIHHHIARIPVSPSEVLSGIPEVLGAIILKLRSKNA
jgi:serine/threonine protein kinase